MKRLTISLTVLALLLTVSPTQAQRSAPPRFSQYGYTGTSIDDQAAIFDLQTSTLVGSLDILPEGEYPYDATMRPDSSEVWISGASGDGVVVIDTETNQITHRIGVGEYPVNVTFRSDGAYAFVANRDTEDVTVIDTATYSVIESIPIPTYSLGAGNMALNPCSQELYLVDWYNDHLFVLDSETFSMTQEIPLGDSLWQLVVPPKGDRFYVTDRGLDLVHVLDTATMSVITTIPVGDDPWGIDITFNGELIYVTNEDSHDVTAIDATNNTVITTIPLPSPSGDDDPRDVDFSLDGSVAYVTSGSIQGDDQVYVIDTATHTVIDQINVSPTSNPNVVAVAPQIASCGGLTADKRAYPEPVVLGDPLTYTIDYLYTSLSPTLAYVTDTLPVGTGYLTSSGGLSSTYDIVHHQVIWDLGTVPSGGIGELTVRVLPVDEALAGQEILNEAFLDFTLAENVSATVWVTSTVVTPELAIRLPSGAEPPDPLPTCIGDLITLTGVSNRAGPLDYAWSWGDGSLGVGPTVSHTYATTGTFAVWLTTTNTYGWVETDTLSVEVGRAPVAGFLSNSPVELGQPARFTDTSAFEPDTWFWDMGDGGTSEEQNPVYTYTTAGLYTVTLTVGNDCGADTTSGLFQVLPPPCDPVTGVVIAGPSTLPVSQTGVYTATYLPVTATLPVTLTWSNGTISPTASYSWTTAGVYTVVVTATNPCGQVSEDLVVQVIDLPTAYQIYLPIIRRE